MNVMQLIQKDVERMSLKQRKFGLLLSFVLLICVPPAVGLLWRADFIGVFSALTLLPNLGMLASLSVFPLSYFLFSEKFRSKSVAAIFSLSFLVMLLLSLTRFFLEGESEYINASPYWFERCFFKGLVTGIGLSVGLTLVVFRYSPLPTRRWRLASAITAAMGGVAMLGFHCDSASLAHTVVAHWGEACVVAAFCFLTQSVLFRVRIRRALGNSAKTLSGLNKIE